MKISHSKWWKFHIPSAENFTFQMLKIQHSKCWNKGWNFIEYRTEYHWIKDIISLKKGLYFLLLTWSSKRDYPVGENNSYFYHVPRYYSILRNQYPFPMDTKLHENLLLNPSSPFAICKIIKLSKSFNTYNVGNIK